MDRGRDRSGFPGLRVASGGDLIEDIHRQQRRRLLKRAAQLTALAIALLLIGLAFKVIMDRRAQAQALETAYEHFVRGTPAELEAAVEVLQLSIDDVAAEHAPTLVARALVHTHLLVEFGRGEDTARSSVGVLTGSDPGVALAQAMIAYADGDLETAATRLEEELGREADEHSEPFVQSERAWLQGLLAVARSPDDEAVVSAAVTELEAQLEREPQQVAPRRALASLHLVAGRTDEAQRELELAREHGRTHMGPWADQALVNAYLRQEMSGAADVADQLLDESRFSLMNRQDQAHAELSRAVVHVHSGELEDGLDMLDRAWDGLPPWDRLSRRLAIQTALEAGDASRLEAWIEQSALPEAEGDIYRAWAVLVDGDVMEALRRLAELSQSDPWVAYLQALALVEQGRFAEGGPWIDRTEKLLPGRLEIEVARARVELRTGDKKVALRKLKALAEEKARAPRAWTGLGEAHLLQDDPDEAKAKKALERAVDREPLPAEAQLLLGEIWDGRRGKDPKAEDEAREWFEKASKTNTHLPRYRERLALYLDDIGFPEEAEPLMKEVVDEPGIGAELVLRLTRLEAEDDPEYDPEPRLEEATERGAAPEDVTRLRARIDLESGDKARIAKAQEALGGLVAANSRDVEARELYARTFLKQFDRKAAETTVRRGIAALEDKDQDGRLLLAWAEIEARTGKGRLAAPRARRAFLHMLAEERPPLELIDAADLTTRLWLRFNKERTAVAVAQQLTDRLGYHTMAWTIRARTELGAGEAGAARESAQRAIELDDENPRAHEILGHALLRYGLKDQAKTAYEKAVELTRGTPDEADYRANLKRL